MAQSYKKLLVGIILFLGLCNSSSAQTIIPASDAPKYVGKVVSFFEMGYTVKFSASSKTWLVTFPYPGTRDNSPIITIVFRDIKSLKRIRWLKSLKGNWLNLTGRLSINKGNYIIDGNDPNTKISIYYGTIEVPEVAPLSDTTRHE